MYTYTNKYKIINEALIWQLIAFMGNYVHENYICMGDIMQKNTLQRVKCKDSRNSVSWI